MRRIGYATVGDAYNKGVAMENNRIVPFNMDEQGLLRVLDRLIDRLNGCGSSECDAGPDGGHPECAE